MKAKHLIIALLCFMQPILHAQQASVLAEGHWVKMGFTSPGVYKISWNKLREMGFSPESIDPRQLAVYGNPGGMLPQSNSDQRPIDLTENAIVVSGANDGVFNENDFILFYVDSPHKTIYDGTTETFQVEKNLYSDSVFYFLTHKPSAGKRARQTPNLGTDHQKITQSRYLFYHENDLINLLSSGREWLGESITSVPISFQHSLTGLAEATQATIHASLVAQAFTTTQASIKVNGSEVGQMNFNAIPNSQYTIKGNIQQNSFSIPLNLLSSDALEVSFSYDRNSSGNAVAYLDKYLVEVEAKAAFQAEQKTLRFTPDHSGLVTYQLETSSNDLVIWNISDPSNIAIQEFNRSNNQAQFGAFTEEQATYQVFNPSSLPEPLQFKSIANQNLRATPPVDFLIVTHESLISQAERLATFRRTHDLMSVQVASTSQIYNEFSSGRQDIVAIRDFIRHKYDQGNLKYVLFLGKGSFDYKNRVSDNTNLVPTYESRNSIHPLLSYSSDDFFGFLDNDEGFWEESTSGDHQLDIGIGRIPARNYDQAKKAIDKIILYHTHPNTMGNWKSKILFVADDGDRNIHQRDADQLATLVDTTYHQFRVNKFYLDAFEQERKPNGEFSPAAEKALLDAVNQGKLIINFTGHGAEFGWTQERILTFNHIDQWRNTYKMPFLITATCEFGRNDDPNTESGAERLIFKNTGGAIGLLTTARPVFSSTNYRLNEALYGSMLKQNNGEYQRLGDVIKFTKNNSLQGSLNRNFILLGDPSMRLAYPQNQVEITHINGKEPSETDTLRALQPIQVRGRIISNGSVAPNFNGIATIELLDKTQPKITLGSENAPFEYKERDRILFRGEATVEAGHFTINFTIPKNIDYSFGHGKIQAYAKTNHQEALGSTLSFSLGGTHPSPVTDTAPPEIRIFLNDTLAPPQSPFDPDVLAIVKLRDQTGINISNAVLGQNLMLILNDTLQIDLGETFTTLPDKAGRGMATTLLQGLPEGKHRIEVRARDSHGNAAVEYLEFEVMENSSYITEIKSYPNPFIEETFFKVSHKLVQENLLVSVDIISNQGKPVHRIEQEVLSAEATLEINWNGKDNNQQRLNAGIYFYTLKIVSKTTGKSDFVRRKLIISN
ncbi:type IX secretion system sortase PorU [Roseivirga thermotolerans]|uniref:type IX secretion system sortase PorU n=1 Tax=Roseivirga thermotolerans TaxID=1758176 RepID=UPI00273E43BE|nr:type IX secretion system sortase PorU [Roseivirga thermotolerans]